MLSHPGFFMGKLFVGVDLLAVGPDRLDSSVLTMVDAALETLQNGHLLGQQQLVVTEDIFRYARGS